MFVAHVLADINAESRVEKPSPMYVPRDEQFEEIKQSTFLAGRLKAVLHNLIPLLKASISAEKHDFSAFSDIDVLYKEGLILKVGLQDEIWKKLPLPKIVTKIQESSEGLLKYDTPKIVSSEFLHTLFDEFINQFAFLLSFSANSVFVLIFVFSRLEELSQDLD